MPAQRVQRHTAVFGAPRHRARFLGPGAAIAAGVNDLLLINSSGDHLLINSSGDKLRIN